MNTPDRPQTEASAPDQHEGVTPMPWTDWRPSTPARIALGRAGVAIPTDESLRFGLAHALARDAIHTPLDTAALQLALEQAGHKVLQVRSQASDRTEYLRRPDLGRRLNPADTLRLQALATEARVTPELCVVVGDGLSSLAVQRHAAPLLAALLPRLAQGWRLAPVVLVQQARVAVADEVGEALGARLSVILIGERPGLSSPDSLGIYLTHGPRVGRHDAERNCISNVRPQGLSYEQAAHKLAWLIRQALQRGLSGVALKDESETEPWLPGTPPPTDSLVSVPPSSQEKT
ncbi:MAG: ethanolamine ammonia-lyase subunit EutC [Curvibacter sp.]|nr:MAG: ethanolamine ammonia-lyase subunit EutC [Curvibacter sp.]